MITAENLTRSLRGTWFGGYGTACCPAHEDKNPSLSITDGMTGQLLLKCHAGCDYVAIRTALNRADLRDHYNPNQSAALDHARQVKRQAKAAAHNKRRETQA
ncbi:MAG: hypothetical protein IME92_09890, partial [Proteobacteria bacterium]|nr:hypothetical protein [Pseudomonadota bacterium]